MNKNTPPQLQSFHKLPKINIISEEDTKKLSTTSTNDYFPKHKLTYRNNKASILSKIDEVASNFSSNYAHNNHQNLQNSINTQNIAYNVGGVKNKVFV